MKQLAIFLAGKTNVLTRQLKNELKIAKEKWEFERAGELKEKLELITEVTNETAKLKHDYFLPNLASERSEQALIQLKQILSTYWHLPRQYRFTRIEGYDVSNTSGKQAVVSMIVFIDGVAEKSEYRSFNIKTLNSPNDVAMLAEVLERREKHDEWDRPELILIDGGKGQVRSVLRVLEKTKWHFVPIIGLAKNPDRIIIPVKKESETQRMKIDWVVLTLTGDNLALQLLQQIRDEAHRFGKSKHIKRRQKEMLGKLH
jgi:excinuclease ABC subunit C